MSRIDISIAIRNPLDKEVVLVFSIYDTEIGTVLILKNPDDNQDQDILGGVQFYIPLLVRELNLDINNLIVVVVSSSQGQYQDDKYRQVFFSTNIETKSVNSRIVSFTKLYGPRIQPLSPQIAQQLQFEGLVMSQLIGKDIVLRTSEAGDISGRVLSYDGCNYLIDADGASAVRSYSGKVLSVS